SAGAPRHARRGQTITVQLRVRVVRGQLETFSFPLTIPRHERHHRLRVSLRGASASSGQDDLLSALAGALGGPGGPLPPGPPPSRRPSWIADLRQMFSRVAGYEGIGAKLGGRTEHVYRNGSLLIPGHAALRIRIK